MMRDVVCWLFNSDCVVTAEHHSMQSKLDMRANLIVGLIHQLNVKLVTTRAEVISEHIIEYLNMTRIAGIVQCNVNTIHTFIHSFNKLIMHSSNPCRKHLIGKLRKCIGISVDKHDNDIE